MEASTVDLAWLRSQIVGVDEPISTPFGERLLVYADYTASGRSLRFIEEYLLGLGKKYANTHTEDDATGREMTRLLHAATTSIKRAFNAGPGGRIVACGTGATGAIHRLQDILGVAMPPATRHDLFADLAAFFGDGPMHDFAERHLAQRPVVFLGPYEHHSNEVSWRQGFATVVNVDMDGQGGIDLAHLESLLADPRYLGRRRIGSFSAASNVTGMRSPVHAIAKLLHAHDALACFDYAAAGPYVEIDMNPPADGEGGDASIDAVYLSPHKFIGGPGASGVLVFNEKLYRKHLPPTVSGGGTVDYVNEQTEDFVQDIEARESAGTPGVIQTLRAALAIDLKREVGTATIEAAEARWLQRLLARWQGEERIEVLGNPDGARRIAIVSFIIRTASGRTLHPKLVTHLLNDLFGIQSRAGCSCAGPYGHRLLGIGPEMSQRYRELVKAGLQGIKPGWCRIGLHFAMDQIEVDYLAEAVAFIARRGEAFLALYDFDPCTGAWTHRGSKNPPCEPFSIRMAMRAQAPTARALPAGERAAAYARYLVEAEALAAELAKGPAKTVAREPAVDFGELQFFAL
jgi:selenocysteine lyase/cysteine desulfurase